jgi:hypothetical protein
MTSTASCLGRRSGTTGGGADSLVVTEIAYPFTIDVSKDYPMEPVSLQEVFGETEYVALETTPECLIADLPGLQSPVVTDNDIFICSGKDIFRFARDGKFLNRIGHEGRGPGEFLSATEMCVNDPTEEVFIYDVLSKGILVYGYDGRHKRTLRTDRQAQMEDMIAITDSTLLIANGHDNERKPVDAFQLISSKTGSLVKSLISAPKNPEALVPTDLPLPKSGAVSYWYVPNEGNDPSNRYKTVAGGVGLTLSYHQPYGILREAHNIYVTAAGVELTSLVADTVYVVSDAGELTPRWIKVPSPMESDVPKRRYSRLGMETERYAFFWAIGNGDQSAYKMNKSTGAITRTYLYDANVEHELSPLNKIIIPTGINTGRFAMPYQPVHLIDGLEMGALSGEIATLAATLNEDDNPVLMIAKKPLTTE